MERKRLWRSVEQHVCLIAGVQDSNGFRVVLIAKRLKILDRLLVLLQITLPVIATTSNQMHLNQYFPNKDTVFQLEIVKEQMDSL